MTPTDAVLLAGGADAVAAVQEWIPFFIIVGLIATGFAFHSKGLKLAIPVFLGFAAVSVYLYNPQGVTRLGSAVLSFLGLA